jgi:hypothetical protein
LLGHELGALAHDDLVQNRQFSGTHGRKPPETQASGNEYLMVAALGRGSQSNAENGPVEAFVRW